MQRAPKLAARALGLRASFRAAPSSMRKVSTLLALTSVLTLTLAAVARAVPPQHFPVEHIDDTFTIDDQCTFPVIVHLEGDVRNAAFFDQAGNEVRDLTVFPNLRV